MTDWQPIETAPKDGSGVLLYDRIEEAQAEGYWCKGYGSEGAWVCAFMGGTVEFADMTPSHWMPLPAPPQDAST